MASLMPTARDVNGAEITTAMVEHARTTDSGACRAGLTCVVCEAPVEFVTGHTRQLGDGAACVEAFFRLQKGCRHRTDCRYNLRGQIEIVARTSESNFVRAIEKGQFEFRLLAPDAPELIGADTPGEAESKRTRLAPDPAAKEKIYVEADTQLGAYINSAIAVLKLRVQCEDNAEIQKLLRLKYKEKRVRWSDFYFEYDDYFRCFDIAKSASRKKETFPIAVRGAVRDIKPRDTKGGARCAVLEFGQVWRAGNQPGVTDAACFSIWSKDLQAFDGYAKDQEILAFGWWWGEKIENEKRTFLNYRLTLWPNLPSQVCAFSDSSETTPRPREARPRFVPAQRKPAALRPAMEYANYSAPHAARDRQDTGNSRQAEARPIGDQVGPTKTPRVDGRRENEETQATRSLAQL